MIDWQDLTLFLFIAMRMAGFVLLNPFFGRNNIPRYFQAGMSLLLAVTVYFMYPGTVEVPAATLELAVRLFLELGLGFTTAIIMHIFFYIPELAGRVIDDQMGMSMASTYDPGTQSQMTTTSNLLYILMALIFFIANGHVTLLEIIMTSGEIVPFGAVSLGDAVANRIVELFIECTVLAVKMCLPVLAAEMLGQVGMGILMKVIPQINVFAINIELKVIIGLTLVIMLLSPFSDYLLEVEKKMLVEIERTLALMV